MASPLPKEREILIKHYAKLTSTVRDIDNLLPHFVAARIINQDDTDEIKAVARTSERVAKLLKYISGICVQFPTRVCLSSLPARSFGCWLYEKLLQNVGYNVLLWQ